MLMQMLGSMQNMQNLQIMQNMQNLQIMQHMQHLHKRQNMRHEMWSRFEAEIWSRFWSFALPNKCKNAILAEIFQATEGEGWDRPAPTITIIFLFFTNTSNLCYQINWKSQNIFRMASLNESWSVPISSFPFDWSEKVTLMNDIERQDILVFIDSGWKDTSIVL